MGQEPQRHAQGNRVGVAGGDAAINVAGQRHRATALGKEQIPFAGLGRFVVAHPGRLGSPGEPAEVAPGRRQRRLMPHGSGDNQGGVVGHIISVPEPANVAGRCGAQVGERANGQPAVRMMLEQRGHDALGNGSIGRIEVGAATLFFDDAPLGLERVVANLQKRHTLGFEPEDQVEFRHGHRVNVRGVIEIGVGVAVAARGPDEVAVLIITNGRAAPEH